MSNLVVRATLTAVGLEPSSIPVDWILSGTPKAWKKELARTPDQISRMDVWECTAGQFNWHYDKNESVVVISGEAFLMKPDGKELRFGAGDVGFFPAGTVCTWRVPNRFRKVAVLQESMWRPVGYAAKAWNRILQVTGLSGKPSLVFADQGVFSEPPRKVG